MLKSILEISIDETIKILSKKLTEELNEKIAVMLSEDPLFIEDIKKTLIIKGGKPGELGSVGQMARIGYIFITALLSKTNFTFPLVVDSPVTGMEFAARRHNANLLSQLDNQVIVFILDSEKERFSDVIDKNCPDNVSFTTMYRYNDKTKRFDENLPNNIYKSNNGMVVYDKDFFYKFDLDQEE